MNKETLIVISSILIYIYIIIQFLVKIIKIARVDNNKNNQNKNLCLKENDLSKSNTTSIGEVIESIVKFLGLLLGFLGLLLWLLITFLPYIIYLGNKGIINFAIK